jgi:cephalosporin-C deacetylase-like acetyl esterase
VNALAAYYPALSDMAGYLTGRAGGWNDEICPPTSMHAAYNVVTARKELLLAVETGHFTVPEQTATVDGWIDAQVGKR